MKTFLTIALLSTGAVVTTSAQAPPAKRAAQPTAGPAQEIASAWAAYAQGRLDDAVRTLGPLTGSVEVGHDAADLLIRIEAGRAQIKPALSAYEGWLRESGRDDRFLLYPVAIRVLTTLGGSSDAAIKGAALARLAAAGLGPGATDTSGAALTERAGAGDKVAQQQLAEMMTSDPAFVRAGMVKALAAGGGASVQQMVTLLKHPAPDVRAAAVDALGSIGGPQALTALQSARADNDPYVKLRVTVALARAGDQDALAAANTALSSPVADIRVTAAEAFADHPTEASQAALRSALADANPLTRARAASLLGDADDASAALLALLSSENPTVREETAKVAEYRVRENIFVIRQLLASSDPWQQLYGAGALLAHPAR